jgi:galactose-1-phosphate uridylyltransferase
MKRLIKKIFDYCILNDIEVGYVYYNEIYDTDIMTSFKVIDSDIFREVCLTNIEYVLKEKIIYFMNKDINSMYIRYKRSNKIKSFLK